jgi:hypothetical protein
MKIDHYSLWNPVNVTISNLKGLDGLCEEFRFNEFSAKLSKFSKHSTFFSSSEDRARGEVGSAFAQVCVSHLREPIEFILNEQLSALRSFLQVK